VSEASKAAQARQAGEAPEARGARDGPDTPEAPQKWDDRETRVAGRACEAGQARQGPGTRDSAAVRQFIQRFASLLADAGMPRMPARIFVALLTADTSRLTAEELAGLLRVSPAAVSGGVRYLIQVGLVSRETEPGSRRHVYVMPDNVWHEVLRVRDGIMMRWADAMRGGAEVLGAGTPAGTRLAESAMYFEFVSKELPLLLDRWEDYKAAHRD
jgi:DNA-binding transcriptional regulator GbsR (MarR family)